MMPGLPFPERRRVARVVAGAALVALSALGAVRVFDDGRAALLALAAFPGAALSIAWGAARHRWWRWPAHAAMSLAMVSLAILRAGGQVGADLPSALGRAWPLLSSTDWPSPWRPELVGGVAVAVALAGAFTAELASTRRWNATALVPSAALAAAASALAAPAGPPPTAAVGGWLALAALVMALAGGGSGARTAKEEALAERRGLSVIAVLCAAAIVASITIGRLDRHDPRRAAVTVESVQTLNPLSGVIAERLTDPAQPVVRLAGVTSATYRTQVLDRFDGTAWTSGSTVYPVNRNRLSETDGEPTASLTMTVLGAPLSWVPLPGVPVAVDRDVAAPADRSSLQLTTEVTEGGTITVEYLAATPRSAVGPDAASAPGADPGGDGLPAWLEELAGRLAGDGGSLVERLDRLEAGLRSEFTVNRVRPAGPHVGLLRSALVESRNATPEQFAAAFTLMSRSLGATSRIALGYVLPAAGQVLTTADAAAWPEVWFEGAGWVAYDPVPIAESEQAPGPRQQTADGGGETPPSPSVPPRQEPNDPPEEPVLAADEAPSWLRAALYVAAPVLTVLVAAVAVIGGIVVAKRRRRRRRLTGPTTAGRVLGAWAEATDRLVELGVQLRTFETNGEIVDAGARRLGLRSKKPLGELAAAANSAAHASKEPDELSAALAVRLLGQVEQVIGEQSPRHRRVRARLSVRPFRRATRSPVA